VDTASPQPGELVLPLPVAEIAQSAPVLPGLPSAVIQELWLIAEAEGCALTREEFAVALNTVGAKLNHGFPSGYHPDPAQKIAFFRGLHLKELALANACALGREAAWQRFLKLYRDPLTQAAIAIAGSATLGHELADSLYAELYGLKASDGERRSPVASYTGRGSLLGWLRTTLAQRHIDHHRGTRRESPLDGVEVPAPTPSVSPAPEELTHLAAAVARTLQALPPEDRYLLSAYFLDRQTLLQIGRTLRVHEATISRRLKRLTADLRKLLLRNLQSGGLSGRAAEESLGTDPRDIDLSGEINLRRLLQTSQTESFLDKSNLDRSNEDKTNPANRT